MSGTQKIIDNMVAQAADWDESKHPRDKDGRFGSGGGAQKADHQKYEDLHAQIATLQRQMDSKRDWYNKNGRGLTASEFAKHDHEMAQLMHKQNNLFIEARRIEGQSDPTSPILNRDKGDFERVADFTKEHTKWRINNK